MTPGPISDSYPGPPDPTETLNCAFCGFQYSGPKPVSRDVLAAHVRVCPEHPLAQELAELREQLTCPICAGQPHASLLPCACKGTNKITEAFAYVHREWGRLAAAENVRRQLGEQ